MAQAVSAASARIDHFLDYLVREWEAVPDYAEEFGTWDDVQQLAFVHEWDIRESALRTLRDYAEQGLMTSAQLKRYNKLLKLVAQHRPTIAAVLSE